MSFTEALIRRDMEHHSSLEKDSLLSTSALITQDIQQNISNGIFVTETLHALLESNNFALDKFNIWGKQIIDEDSGASSVQIAPDGIVQYIYPLKGNEKAIGHDLLKDKDRDDGARKAITSKEITFVGPIKLIQNNKYAVIARKPVFIKNDDKEYFWGFTIALLLVQDILPKNIEELEKQGLLLLLEGDDPDSTTNPVFFKSAKWDNNAKTSIKIKIPNGNWVLKLSTLAEPNKHFNKLRMLTLTVSTLIFCIIFIQQYKMRRKQQKITQLNNQLNADIENRERSNEEKERLITELKKALTDVKALSGLLPICAKCKKIKDDDGYWNNLETYIEQHSEVLFSHGMCKECADELYGNQEWYKKAKNKK